MIHPKDIGDRTTLAVSIALRGAGYRIYLPFGENTRVDLVVDDGAALYRVQCKTGRLRKGAVRFRTSSSYAHHPNPKVLRRNYLYDVEYFAVHCLETSGVYLIPIADVPLLHEAALRVEPPRNNQTTRIRYAARYEVGSVEVRVPRNAREQPGAGAGAGSPALVPLTDYLRRSPHLGERRSGRAPGNA